jgi:hypothetical protein
MSLSSLVPMVFVESVSRSIAFYRKQGFASTWLLSLSLGVTLSRAGELKRR